MNLTHQPMFPTEQALTAWLAQNCERCYRGRHRQRANTTTSDTGYTKAICTVNQDILLRQSDPTAPVSYQSCRRVQNAHCPLLKPLPPTEQQPLSLF